MTAVLLVMIDVDPDYDNEFNDWYDTEHVPERLAVAGIDTASRWRCISGDAPRYAALFEARHRRVFEEGPYADLKKRGDTPWTARLRPRFEHGLRGVFDLKTVYRPGGSGSTMAVALTDVPATLEDRYASWYDQEHGPLVGVVTGVTGMARYTRAAEYPRHLTIIEVSEPGVLSSDNYRIAKERALGDDLRQHWSRTQGVYRLHRRWE